VPVLALKLILTPLLIGGASLAARRWGPAIGGWLVGLAAIAGFTLAFAAGLVRAGPRTGILVAIVAFASIGVLV
jgi:hypothetical protein